MIEVSNNVYNYLSSLYDENSAKSYIEFIKDEPTQYIRVNLLKTNKADLADKLFNDYGIETEDIPSLPCSLKIKKGKELVGKTIEHIIGLYYVQGLSSMIPPLVLAPSPGNTVLDLCSAPGSKTTEICELMKNKGTVIANEIALNRVKMLVYNLDRMNIVNTAVSHSKGELLSKIYNDHFDKILVDAPCSGLGIIQKKEEVNKWWSLERAEQLGNLQLRLLIAAIKMAKQGGEIVYSTCTLTPEENEFIINKVLEKYPVEIVDIDLPIKSIPGFTNYNGINLNPSLSKSKRILPWEVDSDGFFIVKLKKTGATTPPEPASLRKKDLQLLNYEHKNIRNLFLNIKNSFGISKDTLAKYKYLLKGNDIFFVNYDWNDENLGLFERIGTRFGVIDKKGGVTLHTQAAQILQDEITGNIYDIEDQNELKKYLEGGIIKKDSITPGQCVIKYKNKILGTAVVTNAGIKSRFPRAKRTQEIFVDF